MNDLRGSDQLRDIELDAVRRVIDSGWYVLGSEVEAFERSWAQVCDSTFAIGVGNGMDAIEIGLRASGFGEGDEVVTTSMTAFATVLAIIRAGATPVLADIDPSTAMLDPESVKRCITPRTRAILLVHLYGQVGPVDQLLELCGEHGLTLVEDCAQAHLARDHTRSAGSRGKFGAWSFYPTKNLGAIGDGGAITTSDPQLASTAMQIRNYGQSARYQHDIMGVNSRLDELQAALLSVRLEFLQEWTQRRREVARLYHELLVGDVVLPLASPSSPISHSYHLFVVTSPYRDQLRAHLARHQIETLAHYPIPAHFQKPCLGVARDPEGLSATERHADQCLSLPCHPGLTDEDVSRVAEAVSSFRP